jgi:hypothetical protein
MLCVMRVAAGVGIPVSKFSDFEKHVADPRITATSKSTDGMKKSSSSSLVVLSK